MRTDLPASNKFGQVSQRIGVRQQLSLPSELSFSGAKRRRSNSVFAAPMYGPSLRYLGLLQGEALAQDGSSTGIPIAFEDDMTSLLAQTVEGSLSASFAFAKLARLDTASMREAEIDDLGLHGLCPGYYRTCPQRVRRAFMTKLLPTESGNGRSLTAKLLIATLEQQDGLTTQDIRAVWHTGRFSGKKTLRLSDQELVVHRERWSVFQARQYQRYVIELFMWCFENAILAGSSSMADITESALQAFRQTTQFPRVFRDCLLQEARSLTRSTTFETISERWNREVHGGHPSYIGMFPDEETEECERALRMLARWWLRMVDWLKWDRHQELFALGGEDRISMKWFGAQHSARVLRGVASSVRVAVLPAEFKESEGEDVRDVLRRPGGRELVLQAIADAQPVQQATASSPEGEDGDVSAEVQMPEGDPLTLTVSPCFGKPQRLVVAKRGEVSHRDRINTDSSISRDRFVKRLAGKLGMEIDALGPLVDPQITVLADQVEEQAKGAGGDGGDENQSQATLAANMAAELGSVAHAGQRRLRYVPGGRAPGDMAGPIKDVQAIPGQAVF
ncbi:MAG: hypothetical protein KKE86_06020 [Planctomycetes bacterium]|nr:hypothetical protein [Planctomycetota bacterium]MBU4398877.1 hypothetical protein [Planctomycetota bacterium]MCG2681987.1 hypothetical protein [Planctomycetales bacterium]